MKKPVTLIPAPGSGGDVYALVQSLSNSEQAIVRKSWTKGAAKKLPLQARLFEGIAEKGIADDAAAQKSLSLTSGAQFSNLKQHLIAEILNALVFALREDSPAAQLHFGIMHLYLLAERSQTALARRLCRKLWLIAEEAGEYSFALELLYYRGRLTEQRSFRQYAAQADEIASLTERYTAYLHTAQSIQRHTDKLALLRAADQLRVSDEQNEGVRELMAELAALSETSAETPHLRLRYLAATATGHYMLRAFSACSVTCEEALELLEAHPALSGADAGSFLSIANIAFYNEFAAGNISRVSGWLSRFDSLAIVADNNDYFHKRWAIIRFNTTLKIAHKTADYEGVAQLIDRRSGTIMAYAVQVMPPVDGLSVINSVCISLFALERFSEAESLMLEIKERNRSLERQDVFFFTLVFHLVILYELKDWYRLDAATQAAYHVLYNRKKLRPFEKELMSFLKALPAKRGGGMAQFITAFLEKLDVYKTDPVQRLYFLYFNYYDWLQSKLAGLSYAEYKRRLLKRTALQAA